MKHIMHFKRRPAPDTSELEKRIEELEDVIGATMDDLEWDMGDNKAGAVYQTYERLKNILEKEWR